jgi:hypothetical protein
MKKLIFFLTLTPAFFFSNKLFSQNTLGKTEDFGRISLNVYVPDQVENVSDITKSLIADKLNQIVTRNGLVGDNGNDRFIITPNFVVLSKDITSSAPTMFALTLQVSFYIGDGINGIRFSSVTKTYKGVGTNETKAYISALKNIKTDDPAYQLFIHQGKNKIIEYYNSQCDFILKEAEALSSLNSPDAAICYLSQVPQVCKECYTKSLAMAIQIYKKAQERDCKIKINQAQIIWNSNPTLEGAREVAAIISQIDPETSCYEAAKNLINSINSSMKRKIEDLQNIELKYRYYRENNRTELEKLRIQSLRDISIAYANSRPVVLYNIRGWY